MICNLFIYLILFLISINSVFSIDNEIFLGGTCQNLNENSICFPLLNYSSYYQPPNTTFGYLNISATKYLNLLDLTTPECKTYGQYIFCAQYFPKCYSIDETLLNNTILNIALPSLPCNSLCLLAESPCITYIKQFLPQLSCNSKYNDGKDMFPMEMTNYSIKISPQDDFNIPINCIDESLIKFSNKSIECPKPLLNAKEYVKEGKDLYYYATDNCIIDCPFDIYPRDKKIHVTRVHLGLTIISFICTTFMVVTYGILPNEITHRMESIASFSFGAWLTCLCVFVQRADNNFQCSFDRGRYKTTPDHLCWLAALLFQGGAIIAVAWAPMIGYDLYQNSRMRPIRNFKICRIVLWVLSLLLTIIPAIANKYGSTVASPVCWLVGDNNGLFQYLFFFIPGWIGMISLIAFLTLSIINFTKMYLQTPNKLVLYYNIKTAVTIVIILFVITFVSSFKFYMESKYDEFFDSVYKWALCISSGVEKECKLNSPGFDIAALNTVAISLLGLGIFIGFGLDLSSIKIWKESNKIKWLVEKLGLNKYIHLTSSISSETSTTKASSFKNETKRKSNIKLQNITNTTEGGDEE